MTINATATAPLSLDALFSSVKLTASELKAIKTARDNITSAWSIVENYMTRERAERLGRTAPATEAMHQAAEAFRANPSAELAEVYHRAILRVSEIDVSSASITSDAQRAIDGFSQALRPLVSDIGKRASQTLDEAAAQHKAQLLTAEATCGASGELAVFDSRLESTKAALAAEILEARQQDPLGWITGRGIA